VIEVKVGDALEQLKLMPSGSVHCCVTSPPYWGLRDYSRCQCVGSISTQNQQTCYESGRAGEERRAPGDKLLKHDPDTNCPICKGTGIIEGVKEHQLGLEKTPEEYVQHLVEVFREVKRVLRDDGTFWLNIGDCYANTPVGRFNNYETSGIFKGRDLSGVEQGSKLDKLAASGLNRHPLEGRIRPSSRRLVSQERHHLVQAQSYA